MPDQSNAVQRAGKIEGIVKNTWQEEGEKHRVYRNISTGYFRG
jgi:hypothetical protein